MSTCPATASAVKLIGRTDLEYGLNISDRFRYVYVDNPKTGCSSLKSAMIELELSGLDSGIDPFDHALVHRVATAKGTSPLLRITDLKASNPISALVDGGYKFVTFIRNPYTRLVSGYKDKILKNQNQKLHILKALGIPADQIDHQITFDAFIEAIARQSDQQMDPHWRPQSTQTLQGIIKYDFIGRFENFDSDFSHTFKALGIPNDLVPLSRHMNKTGSEAAPLEISKKTQNLILERFRVDFEGFGYDEKPPSTIAVTGLKRNVAVS